MSALVRRQQCLLHAEHLPRGADEHEARLRLVLDDRVEREAGNDFSLLVSFALSLVALLRAFVSLFVATFPPLSPMPSSTHTSNNARNDNEPDNDPRDAVHAALVDIVVDDLEQVADDGQAVVEYLHARADLEILVDRLVERIQRRFGPEELGSV